MEKSVSGALNVLFCTQPESTPDSTFRDPPIRKIGEPIKPKAALTPPPWPDFQLGGLCEDWSLNPYRCTGTSQVDTGDGLLCLTCRDRREGWI